MPIRCSATSKCWFLFKIVINHIIHTYHTMVAELRRVGWLRHGGREGGHGARGEAVTIVRAAEHVEAAHTRMVHLKVGKKNDLLIARDGSCVAEIRRVREVNKLHESDGWWGQIESA